MILESLKNFNLLYTLKNLLKRRLHDTPLLPSKIWRVLIFSLFITTSCSEPYATSQALPRTLSRLLQFQGIDWDGVVNYHSSSIAVLDAFFHTAGINRATLMQTCGFSDHILPDYLSGQRIIRQDTLHKMMTAMRQLLKNSDLDKQQREELLLMIDTLPLKLRVERVITKINRYQHRFNPNASQIDDVERALAIRERDILNIANKFAAKKHTSAVPPRFFQRALKRHHITLDDMRNYNTHSASMLVKAMRSLRLSVAKLSKGAEVHHQNLLEYLQGQIILRDRIMTRIETFIRQKIDDKRTSELDAYFKKLNTAIRVERATLVIDVDKNPLPPNLTNIVQQVLKIKKDSQQLTAYVVTPNDVLHYRRPHCRHT